MSNGNWQMRMAQWMQGRYGVDMLSRDLMILAIALIVVNFFANSTLISLISLAAMVYSIVRMYSRNIPRRIAELEKYNELAAKPKAWAHTTRVRFANRKTRLYFKCKGCGTMLNVPRGKGKLRVTCPKCGTVVEKKS